MAQVFHPRANALARTLIIAIGLAIAAALFIAVNLANSPYATGVHSTPQQPVPFSHEHHVNGLGIDCRYCHAFVEKSAFAGLPSTKTCMTCHSQLWTQAPMLEPVRESLLEQKPLRWVRVHDLPDYVYFNHSAHVTRGVDCEACHGKVDLMPLTRQTQPLTMGWCLDCHRNANVFAQTTLSTRQLTDCYVCHR